jgi:hypothetical protein
MPRGLDFVFSTYLTLLTLMYKILLSFVLLRSAQCYSLGWPTAYCYYCYHIQLLSYQQVQLNQILSEQADIGKTYHWHTCHVDVVFVLRKSNSDNNFFPTLTRFINGGFEWKHILIYTRENWRIISIMESSYAQLSVVTHCLYSWWLCTNGLIIMLCTSYVCFFVIIFYSEVYVFLDGILDFWTLICTKLSTIVCKINIEVSQNLLW